MDSQYRKVKIITKDGVNRGGLFRVIDHDFHYDSEFVDSDSAVTFLERPYSYTTANGTRVKDMSETNITVKGDLSHGMSIPPNLDPEKSSIAFSCEKVELIVKDATSKELEDLFKGSVLDISINQKIICSCALDNPNETVKPFKFRFGDYASARFVPRSGYSPAKPILMMIVFTGPGVSAL